MRRRLLAALTATAVLGSCLLGRSAAGLPPVPNALDPCTYSSSTSDLNGDGFDDAVVGNPYATVDGRAEAGSVTVLFGDADRRIGEGVRRVITQADGGSRPEAGDHFGWSLSLGDTNGDGCVDILVGSPDEDAPGATDAGIAQVIRFSADDEGGPGTTSGFTLTQAALGGGLGRGDRFGASVVVAPQRDGNGYGFVGAPGEDVDGSVDAGAFNSFALDADGALVRGRQFEENYGSDLGRPEAGDHFGTSLAISTSFYGEVTRPWLLVGDPGDVVDGRRGAGSVKVVSAVDPDDAPADVFTSLSQDSSGAAGEPEVGDGFGASVSTGPWETSTGQRMIVIGAPGEDVGAARDAGMINVFYVGNNSVDAGPSLTQNADGLGRAEAGDRFGAAVAFGPGYHRLSVGVPGEDVGPTSDVGAVSFATVSYSGTDLDEPVTRTLYSPGVPGGSTAGDRFGSTLGEVYGRYEDITAAGVPRQGRGSVIVFSEAHSDTDTVRAWKPGQGGVPAQDGRFGAGLSGFGFG